MVEKKPVTNKQPDSASNPLNKTAVKTSKEEKPKRKYKKRSSTLILRKRNPGDSGTTVMTVETMASARECFYAWVLGFRSLLSRRGIVLETLGSYCKKHTGYRERIEGMKMQPAISARAYVAQRVLVDANLALRYLERKLPNEFSLRREVTGKDGEAFRMKITEDLSTLSSEQLEQIAAGAVVYTDDNKDDPC